MFVVPSSLDQLSADHFFDHPWPSDLRRDPDGTIHFAGFPNPVGSAIIQQYTAVTKGLLYGFSPAAAGYLRFTGDIQPTSLPQTPPDTLSATASLQLVNVDPSSPERGKRHLVQWFWQQPAGVYWAADTLAVQPALGYPLLPSTRYAYVVTTAATDTKGLPLSPSPDLLAVLGLGPVTSATQAARALYAPAVAELAQDGIPAKDIAHLAVFTTNDPTAELMAVRDTVRQDFPPPTVDPNTWKRADQTADYDVYEGWYGPAPNYQAGKLPFASYGDGGGFVFDKNGRAVLQSTFAMRFTFVVPNTTTCPQPLQGYPMVMYAHGTGGDYRSIVDEYNSIGDVLAQHCLASMGVDQIFHGARPGAPLETDPNYESEVEILFFNLDNPIAARTNGREGAIDVVQQARLFTESHAVVPATVSRSGQEIRFDPSRLLFFGHSQGGLNGPLFLAIDDGARGGVLSGSGSMITIALLEKTQPSPSVANLVKLELGLMSAQGSAELNLFHPALCLAQSLIDAVDPIHYVGRIFQNPRPGFAPKSIYQTEGVYPDGTGDSYAPPHGIEVESVALGLPRQAPGVHTIVEAGWSGLGDVTVPAAGLSGNLAGGKASGVLGQFEPAPMDDGHFVVFDVPACHEQAAQFCQNLAADPVGRVPAP